MTVSHEFFHTSFMLLSRQLSILNTIYFRNGIYWKP